MGSALLGAALDTIPFLAGGGPIMGPAIVGQNGRELFNPGTSGTIIANGKFGGSTVRHTWNIDARGSTDPAAVRRMVMQGIQQAAPHLISASVAANREYQRRVPSGR